MFSLCLINNAISLTILKIFTISIPTFDDLYNSYKQPGSKNLPFKKEGIILNKKKFNNIVI